MVVNQIEADVLHADLGLGPKPGKPRLQARQLHDEIRPRGAFVQTQGANGATMVMVHAGALRSGSAPAHSAPVNETEYFIGAGDAALAAIVVNLAVNTDNPHDFTWRDMTRALDFGMEAAAVKVLYAGTMTPMLMTPSPMAELAVIGREAGVANVVGGPTDGTGQHLGVVGGF